MGCKSMNLLIELSLSIPLEIYGMYYYKGLINQILENAKNQK